MTKISMKQITQRLKETIDSAEFKDREAPKGSKSHGKDDEVKPSVGKWGNKGGSKKATTSQKADKKIPVGKWGVNKGKGVKADTLPKDGMSTADCMKIKGHFLKGMDPNSVGKINIKPSKFSYEPVAKMGGKKGTSIFKPTAKSCVTEGIFNGRVEVRVGKNKHVFEAISPQAIRKIAAGYAAVGQPVDVNVFPGTRKSYLDQGFAQSVVNAIHYQTMGSDALVAENTSAAYSKFTTLLESEYNPRVYETKAEWKKAVVRPAFAQAVTRFNEIYEGNLTTYDVTVKASKGKTKDIYELASRGINEGHAAIMSMHEVQAAAGPAFVIESITIGANIYTPDQIVQNLANAPSIVVESMEVDTAFIKSLMPTKDVGINVKTSGKEPKTADKPSIHKPSTKKPKTHGAKTMTQKPAGSAEAALKRDGSGWDKAKGPEKKKPDGKFNVSEGNASKKKSS